MTRIVQLGTADIRDLNIIAPLSKGGLEAANVPDAVVKLGAISKNKLGAPLGVAKLDANGKLITSAYPSSIIEGATLHGNKNVSVTQVVSFKISNYDSSTIYNVTVSAGSVLVSGDTVTFTAPLSAQDVTLTVNGRAVIIPVSGIPVPNTPLVTATSFGINGSAGVQLMTGAFSVFLGGSTHKNTDWDLALDPAFNNIVLSSYDDMVNKTAVELKPVGLNTRYYARARHRDTNDKVSSWSTTVFLTTKNNYIFNTEEAKLLASDRASGDNFGHGVAVSSDGSRIVIGARGADTSAVDSGAAYIYSRSGTVWTQEAKLVASDRAASDRFGISASMTSDGARVAIGAYMLDGGQPDAGAVYIFSRSGTTWTQEAKLVASDRAAGDQFGVSVSMASDGSRVVIGARVADVGLTDTGAAYIFSRSGTVWAQEAKLVASDRAAGDQFGNNVSMTADGIRVAIGAHCADAGVVDAGAAYVFSRNGTAWTQEAKLVASDRAASDRFGISVSIAGEGSRLIVGAYSGVTGAIDAGTAYVFSRNGVVWTQEAKLVADDRATQDYMGYSVSLVTDGSRVVIGAHYASRNGLANSGQIYIFVRSGSIWTQETKLSASDRAAGSLFGYPVSITGDGSRIVTGAWAAAAGAVDTGAAYVFTAT